MKHEEIEWGKGAPYFQNPNIQKITPMEHGNWFAFKEDVDLESTEIDLKFQNEKTVKIKKVLKIVLILLGIAVFLVLGYYFVKDFLDAPVNPLKFNGY